MGDVYLVAQRGLVAHRFDRVDGLHGNLHQRAFGSHHRLLAFDLEFELSIDHGPERARIGVEAARLFGARRRLDVLAVQRIVVHDQLPPVRLPGVLLFEIREARDRFVWRHVFWNLDGFGRPRRLLRRPALMLGETGGREGSGAHDDGEFHDGSSFMTAPREKCMRIVSCGG